MSISATFSSYEKGSKYITNVNVCRASIFSAKEEPKGTPRSGRSDSLVESVRVCKREVESCSVTESSREKLGASERSRDQQKKEIESCREQHRAEECNREPQAENTEKLNRYPQAAEVRN